MRTLLPTILLLSTALAALPLAVQAQETPPALLEDPAADVVAAFDGNPVGLPVPQVSALDLRALTVREDPAGFTIEVHVEDLGDDDARGDFGNVQTRLEFAGATFYVNFVRSQDNAAYFGGLVRSTESGYDYRGLAVERDLAGGRLWSHVERMDLLGGDGQQAGRGDQLTGIRVASASALGYQAQPSYLLGTGPWLPVWIGDAMPDAGTATWDVQFGGGTSEGASLTAAEPFRASNGEATTYLYTVTARHGGGETARYRVFVEGLPDGWNATLPGTLLEIPSGGSAEFPVYVNTTFRHQHGVAATFQLHMHEEGGSRWAMAELGVDYLSVPQPAGHHPDLWFHTSYFGNAVGKVNEALGGTNGYATMNTLEENPADTRVPVAGYTGFGDTQTVYRWSICLEPSLRLGLDFDLARTGALQVPVSAVRPLPGAVLGGRLLHLGAGEPMTTCFPSAYADREQTVLAEVAGTAKDLAPNSEAVFEAVLTPTPESDYVPAAPGSGLVLELTLTAATPSAGASGGAMLMGGHLELPLNEYHDPVRVFVPVDGAPAAAGFVAEAGAAKDAPGPALPAALAALAALALLRRRAA